MNPLSRTVSQTSVIHLSVVLFLTETVRSALMFSFLPAFAVQQAGVTVTVVGIAVSVHYIADTAMKWATGYFVGRVPPRFVLHLAYGVGLVGLFAVYFSHQPAVIIAGAALLGIGASPFWLMCMSAISEENRGTQMGSIYTVWLAGLGFGPVAINFVLDKGFGFAFLFLAFLWMAGWIVALKWNPTLGQPPQPLPFKEQWERIWSRMRRMKPLLPGMVLQTAAAGLLVPVLPNFAASKLMLSYSDYSSLLIAGGVGTVLFLIPMGRLADKWGYKRLMVAGFGALSVFLFVLPYSPSVSVTLLLAIMIGISYSAVLPAWNALLSHFVPNDQKTMGWSVLSGVEAIGVMIGPVVGGWLASRFQESTTVMLSAFILLSLALFYIFYREPARS